MQGQVFLRGPSHGSEQLAQSENQPSLKVNTGHKSTQQSEAQKVNHQEHITAT
jgi:hypothetical protein